LNLVYYGSRWLTQVDTILEKMISLIGLFDAVMTKIGLLYGQFSVRCWAFVVGIAQHLVSYRQLSRFRKSATAASCPIGLLASVVGWVELGCNDDDDVFGCVVLGFIKWTHIRAWQRENLYITDLCRPTYRRVAYIQSISV